MDKIIRLSDLFGVTVDELVREGEAPQSPEPSQPQEQQKPQETPQPQVIYVHQKRERTGTQTAGVVLAVAGAILAVIGLISVALLILPALALIILSLPLILAKKHPWLVAGWVAVGLSCLVLNPYVAVCPWGLIGGLQRLYLYITIPEIRAPSTVFAIAVGITRGLLALVLAYFTVRLYRQKKREDN
ncbi:MAG: hypothetical protein HFF60_11450 [Oscillospiraceae bacterium]|nr:hypothetical protein [Oscillospiraceae bacterium]